MKVWLLLLWLFCPFLYAGEPIELILPASKDGSHEYYHELLISALSAQGVEVTLVTPYSHVPQKRAVRLLESQTISLFWMLETPKRNRQFTKVNVGLTNGFISKRILLVPRDDKERYAQVKNLDDFRRINTIGGFGADWFDIEVWQANKLPYIVRDGEWRALYSMLSSKGGVNYFSRGANEIWSEQKQHPYLVIEPHLLFTYKRDFVFYLSKQNAYLQPVIESALIKAKQSGLMDHLIKKYWTRHFNQLNLNQRVTIELVTP
ncbi:hypothetical protein K6Y31_05870 [Motilimonas cestriensis]|uniref:Solute-binding protein family 3/N-terminal domain-containing protein n=1 Tax=Motilimonas cestriensis TaxID=2742685 RepID=A0ABS8W5T6_9GAMM|nr:hypothetical protein [Motilimonas cestriensis]MCE2594337.1 hypothetical protein [Motilimonas cestriensis]